MKRGLRNESARPARVATELRWLGAIGIVAATVLFVSANLVSERLYHRFDVTRARLYSLSAPTRETLAGLSERVQILVFMSRADPEIGAVGACSISTGRPPPWWTCATSIRSAIRRSSSRSRIATA
jgi:hypothetical protein